MSGPAEEDMDGVHGPFSHALPAEDMKQLFLHGLSEERDLYNRFAKQTKAEPSKISFEFTKDPGLLHQYYDMRERMYISVWGLKQFNGQEDQFDKRSHIVVARKGNQVVGGARFTIKSARNPQRLPMERDDFLLEKLFPDFQLSRGAYGEYSKLAVLPEFTGLTVEITRCIKRKAIANNVKVIYAISPLSQARNHRITASKAGMSCTIFNDIHVPKRDGYDGKMHLLAIDPRGKTSAEEIESIMHDAEGLRIPADA